MSENADAKYLPTQIKCLFIFDAPPYKGNSHLYDDESKERDYFFWTMMHTLYPDECCRGLKQNVMITQNKPWLLNRFKDDGFYVIEAHKEPFIKAAGPALRLELVKQSMDALVEEVRAMTDSKTRILLISRIMFLAGSERFNYESFNVINKELIPIPTSGTKKFFVEKVRELLVSGKQSIISG